MFGTQRGRSDMHERGFDKVETIVGAGTVFVGNLQVKGALRVDGKTEGSIESSGDMVVGEGGIVQSSVQARNVKVAGVIHGTVKASGTLEITPTGKVFGDIEISKLSISDGAVFQGKCDMRAEAKKEEESPKQK